MDHIFPRHLKDADDTYCAEVDVLWNLQPIPADINNYKRARHPREFFNSEEGRKYWEAYDFIPGTADPIWDDHRKMIAQRRDCFINVIERKYDLPVILQDDAT